MNTYNAHEFTVSSSINRQKISPRKKEGEPTNLAQKITYYCNSPVMLVVVVVVGVLVSNNNNN